MFGLPLVIGLVFHMIFLARLSNRNPGWFLLQLLPLVLVTTFTGMGGVIPVALPLVNRSLNMSLLMQSSPLPLMTWWAIVVLGALPGGLLIFLFQRWAIKENLRLWTNLTVDKTEIIIPAWRRLWWWILISISILFTGLFIAIVLIK